jgi:hypothetical protein
LKTQTPLGLFAVVFLLLLGGTAAAQSPAVGTVTFTSQASTTLTSSSGAQTYVSSSSNTAAQGLGYEFTIKGTASASLQILSSAADLTLSRSATSVNISEIRIRSAAPNSETNPDPTLNTPGGQFDLTSLKLALLNSSSSVTLTFTGYKNGVLTGTNTQLFNSTTLTTINFTSVFDDVDDVVITGFGTGTGTSAGQTGIKIDDITTILAKPTIVYNTPQNYTVNTAISSLSPFSTGGAPVSYAISPALPTGLTMSTTTGIITGTPTVTTASATYTVTATNTAGSGTAAINLAVVAAAPTTPIDINTATNTIAENSANGTVVGITAYSSGTVNNTTNLALNKTATATSYENSFVWPASAAVDGNETLTRWSSTYFDNQDFTVDLGASYDLNRVRIVWESAYGKSYDIQVSNDNVTFTTIIKSIYNNSSLTNDLTNLSGQTSVARYIRMHGNTRGTIYGFSMYEFQVFNAKISYSLTNSAGGRFAIDATTGIVTVANSALLDYETTTSHSITVQATDGVNSTTQTFTIAVTNVNEAPVITSNSGGATATISVAESTTAVTTVTATDVDAGDTKTYTITGADAAKFTLTAGGVLTFTTAPDFEVPGSAAGTNAYTAVVTVTDAGGLNDSQTLTINVTNANDAPIITSNGGGATATISIAPGTTAVTTVTATDIDANTITYSKGGTNGALFNINATTGVLIFASAAVASNTYSITVTATDNGTGSLTDVQTLTIIVTAPVTASNYAFSQNITLGTNSMGITTTLTNFPVLVYIKEDALKSGVNCANNVQSPTGGTNGYDFAFTTTTGSTTNELFYQVESFDSSTGTLLAWVQIPSVTNAATTLKFYFGSSTPAHPASFTAATWAGDYRAVYHFSETPSSGSTTADATVNSQTGTTANMVTANLVTGKIGNAYNFNGTNQRVSANPITITSTFTISAWVNLSAINFDQKIMTNQDASGYASGGYKLGVYSNNKAETESGLPSTRNVATTPPAFTASTWHYVQGVYTGSKLSTYVDGVEYSPFTTSTNPFSTSPFYIGVGEGGNTLYFHGIIDEPRVSNAAKSSDWIKAEYYNQNNYLTFTTSNTDITAVLAAQQPLGGGVVYTWTGGTSTVPTLAANWTSSVTGNPAFAPPLDGTCTLVIPTGLSRYPKLLANASVMGLTIASGATFELNGFTLGVGCNIYNNNNTSNGILYSSNNSSNITWNGVAASQNYVGTNTTFPAQVGTMVVNNATSGATVSISGGKLDVYSLITLTAGSIDVAASGTLTLKSSATQSAAIDQLTNTASNKITGSVSVERFLTGGLSAANRGYRMMASPVNQTSATLANTNTFNLNYIKNGAFTGGPGGTASGFSGTSAAPTLYLYKETIAASNTLFTSGKHVGIIRVGATDVQTMHSIDATATLSSVTIPIGNGFLFYFVGNASRTTGSATTGGPPQDATLTATGYLNQGTFNVRLWHRADALLSYAAANSAARGLCMVGNPYASTINLQQVATDNNDATTGISAIYVLNSRQGGTAQNYIAYTALGNSSPLLQGYAVSGGGFIVQARSATSFLQFRESQKVPSTQLAGSGLIMSAPKADLLTIDGNGGNTMASISQRSKVAIPPQSSAPLIGGLYMKMEKDPDVYEYTGIYFRTGYQSKYDNNDALYLTPLTNTVGMASLSSDGQKAAVNVMPDYHQGSRVKLYAYAAATGIYQLKLEGVRNIDELYDIYLLDHFKKDSLDIRRYGVYNFNVIATDTATFGGNRFELVIRRKPVPQYLLTNFSGDKITDGVNVAWKTVNESNYTGFTLEKLNKSSSAYEPVYEKQSDGSAAYSFIDRAPSSGINKYRLKQNDIDGRISYSEPITVFYDKLAGNGLINVFPNPTVEVINVSIPGTMSSPSYKFRVFNSSGNLVMQKTTSNRYWTEGVSQLKTGVYIVEVQKSDGTSLGKGKFVKN